MLTTRAMATSAIIVFTYYLRKRRALSVYESALVSTSSSSSNRSNRIPQRLQILIVERHHTILRLQFECAMQGRFRLFQFTQLADVAREVVVENRQVRHAFNGVYEDEARLFNGVCTASFRARVFLVGMKPPLFR